MSGNDQEIKFVRCGDAVVSFPFLIASSALFSFFLFLSKQAISQAHKAAGDMLTSNMESQ